MKMERKKKPRGGKKRYEKPRVCRVPISLEESLLMPCKGSSIEFGAPVPAPCSGCGAIGS